jgi:molybdate transport system regulatory protein
MNCLLGTITGIVRSGSVAIVEVVIHDGTSTDLHPHTETLTPMTLTAMRLDASHGGNTWKKDQAVRLLFSEMEVALAKNLTGEISMRNRLQGVISAIEPGDVLTRVCFSLRQHGGQTVSSVITTRSAQAMQLKVGDEIEGLVKSNEMNLHALNEHSDQKARA